MKKLPNKAFRSTTAAAMVLLLLITWLPVPSRGAGYYSESDLGNIKATILSNTTRSNYVNTMMKYHILSSTDNYRVSRNLQNGSSVVFFFDGCSDNMDSSTYSDYTRYHLSAYCAVVQSVNGIPKIVYESENCSTIPDNPRNVSLNEGSAVPTVLDGVYNIISTNHLSRYASLRIADNSGSVPVMRCTSTGSYISTSSAINIHARSNFTSAPTNGISSSSYSSTGCFLVGLTNNTWSEYNQFIKNVLGVSNAIITTPYSSGSWNKCTVGIDKGIVVVDRMNYKTQLQKIYGGDNNHTAAALVQKLTGYTDNLSVEIPDETDSRPLDANFRDFLPIYAYPVSTGKITVYDESGTAYSNRYITGATDICILLKIYEDGWCYVSYPSTVEDDGYAEAYVPLSDFTGAASRSQWTADQDYAVSRRSDLYQELGSIDEGDACLIADEQGDLMQVVYPVTGVGYWKMGWIQRVTAAQITGISVFTLPDKTVYDPGEALDLTGLTLAVAYSDGTYAYVSDGFTCSDLLEPQGIQDITVQYAGFETVFSVEVQSKYSLKLKFPALSFEEEVYICAFFEINGIDNQDPKKMGMITLEDSAQEGNIETAVDILPGAVYDEAVGYYYVRSPGISAMKLGDDLRFCVYLQLQDGSYVYSKAVNYSPRTYAYNMLSGGYSAKVKTLVAAMLNYGARAQEFFGYRTDCLVDQDLTEEQKAWLPEYDSTLVQGLVLTDASKIGGFARTDGFSKRYPAVYFGGAFSIHYFFVPSQEPAGEMKLYYWDASAYAQASVLTADNCTGVVEMLQQDGAYSAAIYDLAAKNFDRTYYAVGVYTDAQGQLHSTGVLPYSIGAYCVSQSNQGDVTVRPLAQATAIYGYCARSCFYGA